jgi:hypothetical protein
MVAAEKACLGFWIRAFIHRSELATSSESMRTFAIIKKANELVEWSGVLGVRLVGQEEP